MDALVELDREHPIGLFEYSRLKLHIAGLIGSSVDVVNRSTLKPLLRRNILNDGLAYGGFVADTKTVYAVVRALEIVSEAARRLPPDMKDRYPEIDWAAVSAAIRRRG